MSDLASIPLSIPASDPTGAEQPASIPGSARCGSTCPFCGRGQLDYNGLLELECPSCGQVFPTAAGCT